MTKNHQAEIKTLLRNHYQFSNEIIVNHCIFYEFRKVHSDNLPDFMIQFDTDGIYLCNNKNRKPDNDIAFIIEYLKKNNLEYNIEEL